MNEIIAGVSCQYTTVDDIEDNSPDVVILEPAVVLLLFV